MRKNKDDLAVEAPVNKAAVAGSGLAKSASRSHFDTKPAASKVAPASSIKPAAKVEGKAKQAAATVEVKVKLVEAKLEAAKQSAAAAKQAVAKAAAAKQAAANGIELAAQPNRKWKPAFRVEDKPKAKVIDVRTERVDEDYIEYLRTRPLKMPSPLTEYHIKNFPWMEAVNADIKRNLDLHDDILRQRKEKGYAMVGVELLDNGMKRLFRLPVEATA